MAEKNQQKDGSLFVHRHRIDYENRQACICVPDVSVRADAQRLLPLGGGAPLGGGRLFPQVDGFGFIGAGF